MITPAIVPVLMPLEGWTVSVTTIPAPVVSVVTPGALPVFVLVIREETRVGLLRSAAAEGEVVVRNAKVDEASPEVKVAASPDAEEDEPVADTFGALEIKVA